jgi:hypothetical protein
MTLILGSYEMKGGGRERAMRRVSSFCVNHQVVTPSSTIFTSNQQLNPKKNYQKNENKTVQMSPRKVTSKSRDGILEPCIFIRGYGQKLDSSQTQVFVWFSTLVYPFYKMLFMNRLEFSCFMDFL